MRQSPLLNVDRVTAGLSADATVEDLALRAIKQDPREGKQPGAPPGQPSGVTPLADRSTFDSEGGGRFEHQHDQPESFHLDQPRQPVEHLLLGGRVGVPGHRGCRDHFVRVVPEGSGRGVAWQAEGWPSATSRYQTARSSQRTSTATPNNAARRWPGRPSDHDCARADRDVAHRERRLELRGRPVRRRLAPRWNRAANRQELQEDRHGLRDTPPL